MNLEKLSGKLRDLPEKEKNAILALIDYKTESDMEKVLSKFDSKFNAFDSKFNSFEAKLEAFESKFESFESKFESKFELLNDKIMTTRYLIIGIAILITILKFIKFG